MGLTSTQNVTYREINVKDADLIEDAFGFNYDFNDVVGLLRKVRFEPGEALTKRLIDKIENYGR
ncbi:MAG: hypothetical protein IPN68_07015 [Bacteroidetes bacterium]|nr:hypothetical protein [Bacteroidota bacterium]